MVIFQVAFKSTETKAGVEAQISGIIQTAKGTRLTDVYQSINQVFYNEQKNHVPWRQSGFMQSSTKQYVAYTNTGTGESYKFTINFDSGKKVTGVKVEHTQGTTAATESAVPVVVTIRPDNKLGGDYVSFTVTGPTNISKITMARKLDNSGFLVTITYKDSTSKQIEITPQVAQQLGLPTRLDPQGLSVIVAPFEGGSKIDTYAAVILPEILRRYG
ncbi:MAG: hypothetical protein HZA83_00110, partial [Thaumarchaeota archaeon]|nr:hypothetical protein [Nitrososphaerota archaeon]